MTKNEAMRLARMFETLRSLGFTDDEAQKLRRISMTLRRWHELECGTEGGAIERDENTGKPYWVFSGGGFGTRRSLSPIADRETGAWKRLISIMGRRNSEGHAVISGKLSTYIQTDPRGAALYILRPGDIPEGQTADSCYSRGICVY